MSEHWFDLLLAIALGGVAVSVGLKGIRERSRYHIMAALIGLGAAFVLLYLHRDALMP
jgi:hypothetical protein